MAEIIRKSIRDNIYRQQGICPVARAVLDEEIHYNKKLSKMISIYAEHFLTDFEDKVDEFTEMFYADRYTIDGKVDKAEYEKLRELTQKEYKARCITALAYQVKALPVINFTACSKIERHIVVALGDLRKTHTQEYQSKIEDYKWEETKQKYIIKDLESSIIQQYNESKQAKATPTANKDNGMER